MADIESHTSTMIDSDRYCVSYIDIIDNPQVKTFLVYYISSHKR